MTRTMKLSFKDLKRNSISCCQEKIAQKEVSQSPLPPSSAVQSRPAPIGREIEEKLKKMHVSNSSEDERRTSQSSDDIIQKADDKVKK